MGRASSLLLVEIQTVPVTEPFPSVCSFPIEIQENLIPFITDRTLGLEE
jgi:hypothetical protein